jgi:hypothetical protein
MATAAGCIKGVPHELGGVAEIHSKSFFADC